MSFWQKVVLMTCIATVPQNTFEYFRRWRMSLNMGVVPAKGPEKGASSEEGATPPHITPPWYIEEDKIEFFVTTVQDVVTKLHSCGVVV